MARNVEREAAALEKQAAGLEKLIPPNAEKQAADLEKLIASLRKQAAGITRQLAAKSVERNTLLTQGRCRHVSPEEVVARYAGLLFLVATQLSACRPLEEAK